METQLPWGQPWYFYFNEKLGPEEEKAAMANVGKRLYAYIEKSLGSKNYFTLQLKWSRMTGKSAFCRLDANLVVTREGVTEWEGRNAGILRDNSGEIFNPLNELMRDGTKPPPPPPPPFPGQLKDLLDDPGPLEYLSNLFTLSHVLGFTEKGSIYQFKESHIGQIHK